MNLLFVKMLKHNQHDKVISFQGLFDAQKGSMSRKKELIRQIGNVTIKRNKQLGFTHYKVGRGESASPIDIYVSDEMRKQSEVSFKRIKQLASIELERIAADPYGETSIDPNVGDPAFRNRRAVNRVSNEVEAEIGFPVAVKSSAHATPENLVSQYKVMRDLQQTATRRLGDLDPVIGFLPVYGAVKIDDRQFLIMKHVKDAKEIKDKEIPFASYGWGGVGDPEKELAFSAQEHPQLVAALKINSADTMIRWRTVEGEIRDRLRKPLGDLAGRNVLASPDIQGMRYTIIDQPAPSTYM